MDLEHVFGARLKINATCAKLQTAPVFPCDSTTKYKTGHPSTSGPLNKSMKAAHRTSTKRCSSSWEKNLSYIWYRRAQVKDPNGYGNAQDTRLES